MSKMAARIAYQTPNKRLSIPLHFAFGRPPSTKTRQTGIV